MNPAQRTTYYCRRWLGPPNENQYLTASMYPTRMRNGRVCSLRARRRNPANSTQRVHHAAAVRALASITVGTCRFFRVAGGRNSRSDECCRRLCARCDHAGAVASAWQVCCRYGEPRVWLCGGYRQCFFVTVRAGTAYRKI